MIGFADPELLIRDWLQQLFEGNTKVWADPRLPQNWVFTAPLVHVQRGGSLATAALSMDDVTLDVDVYAKNADHARTVSQTVYSAVTYQLPLTTFQPSGVFVTYARAISAPAWTPDPDVFRRSAAYRIVLHGVVE